MVVASLGCFVSQPNRQCTLVIELVDWSLVKQNVHLLFQLERHPPIFELGFDTVMRTEAALNFAIRSIERKQHFGEFP